ncbi:MULTISPECIES: GNAT family N-acetyltransferase [unclassified Rhizobium]|uniref:GNAT family N-acetyltransferase n=1 Tax=unclassified Rhizobium TaxID=2613769 RepID=UPI001C828937|nr:MULTISPECIES: GNAT family N-acetyltransferase [unclassified Rhizobium]MBX5167416.1 GNAT family N-acetyltransferase [Rhizobium sp. NZLR4b]MBX5174542.1 GNAT family N-acetyltransferase [Rhizobium sp. NZLR1b]MBX5198575.1 GNAT family N-acetyltransferase [Rhizobium sp. NZLR10]MBX5210539.1 GNAT family N-acetyltransferase [Rhizobium sp. NZLR11]
MLKLAYRQFPAEDGEPVAQVYDTIRAIGREAWNACYRGQVEDYDCLLAIEDAGIGEFDWRYITIAENGRISAAMPVFLCPYPLDTTLEEGLARRLIRRVRQHVSGFLVLRLACLGSPCTENGVIGFHAEVPEDRREALFGELLDAFERLAAREGCALMGIKDVPAPVALEFGAVLSERRYAPICGLPSAWLDIDFRTIDEYMARLSAGTRKDMRRKIKSFDAVRVEFRTDVGDVLPRIMALYHDTRNRSEWQFEELTPAYFEGILTHMRGRSFCVLYLVEDELLAANLIVHDDRVAIDKFFCMDGEQGRPYNLYFLSWFTNLRYCLDSGLSRYQSGQAYYENKVRLGSQLAANTMFFRHRNPVLQTLLRLVSPLFSAEQAK